MAEEGARHEAAEEAPSPARAEKDYRMGQPLSEWMHMKEFMKSTQSNLYPFTKCEAQDNTADSDRNKDRGSLVIATAIAGISYDGDD